MPLVEEAVAEKLEKYISDLKEAIAREETLIFDTNACMQSAYGFIENNIKRLRENAANSKVAEVLIRQIFDYIESQYILSMHQYFIKVGGNYLHLLRNIKEINNQPDVQKKISLKSRLRANKRIERMELELNEYDELKTKLTVELLRWKESVERTHFPGFKATSQYEQMAIDLKEKLMDYKDDMDRFGKLVLKQNTLGFGRLIKMAESLLKLVTA